MNQDFAFQIRESALATRAIRNGPAQWSAESRSYQMLVKKLQPNYLTINCSVAILDEVVQLLKPGTAQAFAHYFYYVFATYKARQLETVQKVDVVWNVYHEDSLKRCTREKKGYGISRKVLAPTRIPSDWKHF